MQLTQFILKILSLSLILFSIFSQQVAYAENKNAENKKTDNFYLSPVQIPENIANYPLNLALLDKIEAVQKDIITQSIRLTARDTGNDDSIRGIILAIDNHRQLKAILNTHQILAKDYVLGYMALQASLAAVSAQEDVDAIFDETTNVSKENLQFTQQNSNRIRQLLENSL